MQPNIQQISDRRCGLVQRFSCRCHKKIFFPLWSEIAPCVHLPEFYLRKKHVEISEADFYVPCSKAAYVEAQEEAALLIQ
jgi:hypothetical protein